MRTAERPTARLVLADVLVLFLLVLVATSPFAAAYGGWHWMLAVHGGLAVGLAVARISCVTRLGAWLTTLGLFVAYLMLGPAVATPELAIARVLPGPEALRALLTGVVHAWRDSLTLITPLGSGGTVLVVPYLVGILTGVTAGLLLWRSRVPSLAGLVLVATFVSAAAFGDRFTDLTITRGLVLVVGLLVWTRWRATRDVHVSWPRRLALTTAVLVLAGSTSAALAHLGSDPTRQVLRDHVEPPFDPQDYPSPLSRYRAYYDETGLGDRTMFHTEGLDPGDRIRIATMDTFDGIVWNVAGGPDAITQSGSFGRLPHQPAGDRGEDGITITIEDYSGPWVPTVGDTRAVEVHRDGSRDHGARSRVLFNKATGTMAQVGGVASGASYRFRTVRAPVPSSPETLEAAGGPMPTPPGDIAALTKRTQAWLATAGDPSGGAAAATLTDGFQDGYYSDGKPGEAQSPAGHGVKRITDLVSPEDMIGNAEQYAAAMAVAAQSLGLPARVVLGFNVSDPSGVVRGKDVTAWVEVDLADVGWVAFEPTPDRDRNPRDQQENPEPEPQPYVLQPPVIPDEPSDAQNQAPQGAGEEMAEEDLLAVLGRLLRYLGYASVGVAAMFPLWFLLLVKALRRRKRRRAPDPVIRVSGGWREVADRARDLGVRLPRSSTRYESGVLLDARFDGSETLTLAARADQHVFGPATPTDAEVSSYWADVDTALTRLRRSVPWWRRPLTVLSPASIAWRPMLSRLAAPLRRVGAVITAPLRRPLRRIRPGWKVKR